MKIHCRFRLSAIGVVLSTWTSLAAQPSDLSFSPSSDNLVLSLTYDNEMLADQDPTPLIRIYGDGLVQIHYPVYMKRAGDYEVRITTPELVQLLKGWGNAGVLDFDAAAVKEARRQKIQERAGQGVLFHISDDTNLVIEVNLDWFRPPGSAGQINNSRKIIRWSNVAQEARLFPGLPALQNLAAVEQQQRLILEQNDVRKIN